MYSAFHSCTSSCTASTCAIVHVSFTQAGRGDAAAASKFSTEVTDSGGDGATGGGAHVGSGPAIADANPANPTEPHQSSAAPTSSVLADSAGGEAKTGHATAGTRADSTSKRDATATARADTALEGIAKGAFAARAGAIRQDSASDASVKDVSGGAGGLRDCARSVLSQDEDVRAHLLAAHASPAAATLDGTVAETKQQLPNGFWVPSR